MSESTLNSSLSNLQVAVARYLGLSITSTDWSDAEKSILNMIVKRGLRQFYFPPRVYQNEAPHQWGFLKPVTTIDTVASYSTGTLSVTNGSADVDIVTGSWPSWTATHGSISIDSVSYEIDSVADTTLTLTTEYAGDTEVGVSYTLYHDGNYDLPDDFGGIDGKMTYEASENKDDIKIVGEGNIRTLRRGETSTRSYPIYAAVRPKPYTEEAVSGQRFEIMFYPIPDDVYTLTYKMSVLPNAIGDSTSIPYGGAAHSETIEASCLAIAESQEGDDSGRMKAYFVERLQASIQVDKMMCRARYLGHSNGFDKSFERHSQPFTATYNGE